MRPRTFTHDGEKYFMISSVAEILGRAPNTIRTYERLGVFPRPRQRLRGRRPEGNRRLYSRLELKAIERAAKEEGLLTGRGMPSPEFPSRVRAIIAELTCTTGSRQPPAGPSGRSGKSNPPMANE